MLNSELDRLLKEALVTQRKIDEDLEFIKKNQEKLNEEQEDKLDEIKYKIEEELLPEINRLDKNNPKFFKN
jgi:DNA relaxase NicK